MDCMEFIVGEKSSVGDLNGKELGDSDLYGEEFGVGDLYGEESAVEVDGTVRAPDHVGVLVLRVQLPI